MPAMKPLPLSSPLFLLFSSLLYSSHPSQAQQLYPDTNQQLDCYSTNGASTLGYTCNGAQTSCSTYLTFRSETNYQSPALIASLLNANDSTISQVNGVSEISPIPVDDLLLVPTTCSCANNYYQHNTSYTIKSTGETYFLIANDTYRGLTTCQALIAQNPYDSRKLIVGLDIKVPLRCACPTRNQTIIGVKYLLTYLMSRSDDVHSVSQMFKADYQSVLDANGLSSTSAIFPFTTLLIPLKAEPTTKASASPDGGDPSRKKWVFIGIGIGVGFLILCDALAWYFWCLKKSKPRNATKVRS